MYYTDLLDNYKAAKHSVKREMKDGRGVAHANGAFLRGTHSSRVVERAQPFVRKKG